MDTATNRFPDVGGIHDQMFRLAEAYPALCRVERFGTSTKGRPMLALVINNAATGDERDKPAMYIDGAIHANEIQAAETVTYTAWYLLGAYGNVPTLTALVDRCAFYLVPLVNPDGRDTWFADAQESLGPGILISGELRSSPYTVLAIGDPETLATAMEIPGGVADTLRTAGAEITIDQRETLIIDATVPLTTPEYAEPVEPD